MSRGAGRVAELEAVVARLEAVVADLGEQLAVRDARIAELENQLGEVRRSSKRQAAPFSKGAPSTDPGRPGRKPGKGHGRHGHRMAPADADRTVDAPLPGCCPHCGDGVVFERWADQFQTELPPVAPVVTRFRVGVGRCRGCRRRVQGRHPEQPPGARHPEDPVHLGNQHHTRRRGEAGIVATDLHRRSFLAYRLHPTGAFRFGELVGFAAPILPQRKAPVAHPNERTRG